MQPAAAQAATRALRLRRAIRAVGGQLIEQDILTGSVVAVVPASDLTVLVENPEIAGIDLEPEEKLLTLETSTAAVRAPSMWSAGHLGGDGHRDVVAADLAILHDKIDEQHPAFGKVRFQRPSDAPVGTACGQFAHGCEHGTEVASMAVSRGASGCDLCVAGDALQRGVAPGVSSVLDAEASNLSVDDKAWALGIGSFGVEGADDPAEVMNASHGAVAVSDDSGALHRVDKLISAYGVLIAYPAGNEGPARTVNQSCIAYDTLCMGGFTPRGTVDPSDDVVEDFSSRGPTPGGRKKPDLVAVSTSEFANQHWIRDGRLWSGGSGTSLAAPQGAAAAALLAGSGIAAPIAQKAILINSARQGRATASSPMGTQTGWQPDWGWGALDLESAARDRTNFFTHEVASGDAHFYRADVQGSGERATLVWNRRALGCIAPGCDTTALTLSNLDLEQLDPDSGAVEARSASGIDNVEQVRSPGAGSVIYKVKAASTVDGLPGEPYALAARRPLTRLVAPRPRTEVTVSTAAARPGELVHVMARLTNPSPDLSGENTIASVVLPAGVELVSGTATQTLGTLGPGASQTLAWTVRASGDAVNRIAVQTSAARYGERFGSQDVATFTSDGSAPSVAISAPSGSSAEPAIPVSWTGTDAGVGVRDYTVEVAVDGGAFTTWLTATSLTSAAYHGAPGSRYRFRVRATDRLGTTSGHVTSDEISIRAPVQEPVAPPVVPPTPTRSGAALRVRPVKRRGGKIEIAGTIDATAANRLSLDLQAAAAGRRVRKQMAKFPRGGRFNFALRLPRRATGTVTLRYPGDARLEPAVVRVKLRRL